MKRKLFTPKSKSVMAAMLFTAASAFAQTAAPNAATGQSFSLSPFLFLITGTLFFLLLVILALGKAAESLSKLISESGKKTAAIIILLFLSGSAFAQADIQAATNPSGFPEWVSDPATYIFGPLFLIIAFTIYALYTVNIKLIKILNPQAHEAEEAVTAEGVEAEKKPTFWQRIYLRLVDSVPVAKEKDILLDHDYDGIKELDNNLPPWWKYGFYVTIGFAVCYLFIYHVSGTGKLQGEEYKDELILAAKQKEERMKLKAENINDENVVVLMDALSVTAGKETFQKLCIACHRADGGGQVGPNLTDEYWIHGGGIKNVFHTITYGVPDKGMISWQSQLSPKMIQQVSSYILTLKGTNPPGPKEPQGEKWIEEIVPRDSAKANPDSSIVLSQKN